MNEIAVIRSLALLHSYQVISIRVRTSFCTKLDRGLRWEMQREAGCSPLHIIDTAQL